VRAFATSAAYRVPKVANSTAADALAKNLIEQPSLESRSVARLITDIGDGTHREIIGDGTITIYFDDRRKPKGEREALQRMKGVIADALHSITTRLPA
jgi:hypothetical protein